VGKCGFAAWLLMRCGCNNYWPLAMGIVFGEADPPTFLSVDAD
jgi:hypothetical protein